MWGRSDGTRHRARACIQLSGRAPFILPLTGHLLGELGGDAAHLAAEVADDALHVVAASDLGEGMGEEGVARGALHGSEGLVAVEELEDATVAAAPVAAVAQLAYHLLHEGLVAGELDVLHLLAAEPPHGCC